mmetsp:Transcript_1971/g.3281  ORF Transcript_1971/g.3281 Transcript_1971/m.3281 type:complete len:261 (-) Transcript_1971:55-837(-)
MFTPHIRQDAMSASIPCSICQHVCLSRLYWHGYSLYSFCILQKNRRSTFHSNGNYHYTKAVFSWVVQMNRQQCSARMQIGLSCNQIPKVEKVRELMQLVIFRAGFGRLLCTHEYTTKELTNMFNRVFRSFWNLWQQNDCFLVPTSFFGSCVRLCFTDHLRTSSDINSFWLLGWLRIARRLLRSNFILYVTRGIRSRPRHGNIQLLSRTRLVTQCSWQKSKRTFPWIVYGTRPGSPLLGLSLDGFMQSFECHKMSFVETTN